MARGRRLGFAWVGVTTFTFEERNVRKLRRAIMSRIEAEKFGAITVMKQNLFRVSMVLGAGGAIAAGGLSGAPAASAATPHTPSWHPVLSVPGGGVTEAVVATGKTTGWAFLGNGAAYQRV